MLNYQTVTLQKSPRWNMLSKPSVSVSQWWWTHGKIVCWKHKDRMVTLYTLQCLPVPFPVGVITFAQFSAYKLGEPTLSHLVVDGQPIPLEPDLRPIRLDEVNKTWQNEPLQRNWSVLFSILYHILPLFPVLHRNMGSILHLFAGYGYGMPSRNRRPLPGRLRHAFGQETPTGLGAVWCRCRAATAEVAAMAPELSSGQATWARSWLNFVLSCDLYCKQKMWLFF